MRASLYILKSLKLETIIQHLGKMESEVKGKKSMKVIALSLRAVDS
jgi:hypothetical protein